MLTEITGCDCKVNCFEVSSTGFILKRNNPTLTTLHSFIRKGLTKSHFLSNLGHTVRMSAQVCPEASPKI